MRLKHLLLFLVVLLLSSFSYGLLQPTRLQIKSLSIKDSDIPESFIGKNIIFISDIHFGYYFSEQRLKSLVDQINKLEPDIIILGGDYADKKSADLDKAMLIMNDLDAPLGVYGALGNHDYIKGEKYTLSKMADAGIKSLNNESYWIKNGSQVKIGGVGDLWKDKQDLEATTSELGKEDFSILVSHNPDFVKEIDGGQIDLVLSGHTHAGQITAFGLWAPWVPSKYGQELRYGLKEINGIQLYTTSGIGVTYLPFRFFTRPEIVKITLSK